MKENDNSPGLTTAIQQLRSLLHNEAQHLTIILTTLELQLLSSTYSEQQRADLEILYRESCALKELCSQTRQIVYDNSLPETEIL
ncbi:MAG TPA: hypothetical protein VH186_01475 [Chloroflexia bacterium]|nr:hypothetical protein [Chloroflexia bacterium]